MPKLTADDRVDLDKFTVLKLANKFENFANRDDKFENYERSETGVNTDWSNIDGTDWGISFNAKHNYHQSDYLGNEFTLGLKISRTIFHISEDFKQTVSRLEADLPDENTLVSVSLTHVAEFIVRNSAVLDWSTYKQYIATEYLGDNSEGPVYGAKVYYEQTEARSTPENSTIKNTDIASEDIDKELEDYIETEVHLKQAADIFLMFEEGDEREFDLSTVFPPAFLDSIGEEYN